MCGFVHPKRGRNASASHQEKTLTREEDKKKNRKRDSRGLRGAREFLFLLLLLARTLKQVFCPSVSVPLSRSLSVCSSSSSLGTWVEVSVLRASPVLLKSSRESSGLSKTPGSRKSNCSTHNTAEKKERRERKQVEKASSMPASERRRLCRSVSNSSQLSVCVSCPCQVHAVRCGYT